MPHCTEFQLKGMIDNRRYDEALRCLPDDEDISQVKIQDRHLLEYLVINQHYELYRRVLENRTGACLPHRFHLAKRFVERLALAQKTDPSAGWFTTFAENGNALGGLTTELMIELFNAVMQGNVDQDTSLMNIAVNNLDEFALADLVEWCVSQDTVSPLVVALRGVPRLTSRLLYLQPGDEVAKFGFEGMKMFFPDLTEGEYRVHLRNHVERALALDKDLSTAGWFAAGFLDRENFPKHRRFLDDSLVERICKMTATKAFETFTFSNFVFNIYIGAHEDVTQYDHYVHEGVKKGYAVNGATDFKTFIADLRKMVNAHSQSTRRHVRLDKFFEWVVENYKDLDEIIEYTEKLSPKQVDALVMYSYSSAVFNETFKSVNHSSTQTVLASERRRPTEIQHDGRDL